MAEVLRRDEALRALQANLSPRFRRLDLFERYVDGTQYEGRASWFDDSVPLFDRAPCIVDPIAKSAIAAHAALSLGGHRFPRITTGCDEDDSEEDDAYELGLSEDDSKAVDALIYAIVQQSELHMVSRQLLESAMGCGTAVAVPSIREGRMCVTSMPAKTCDPEFVVGQQGVIKRLEQRFPYLKEERNDNGQLEEKCYLFRRVIDEQHDTTYKPALASEQGGEPKWIVDAAQTVEHGLGFCPVVWYRYRPKHTDMATPDGESLHGHLLDEITAHDFALSQRHRAVLYNADPIVTEIGVEKGYNPSQLVAGSILFSGETATSPGADPTSMAQWRVPGMGGAPMGRKRGPGSAWQYENPETKVSLLALPEGAMQAATENAEDIERKIREALRWKRMDPKEMRSGATMSGRALEMLNADQTEFCDDVRGDFRANGLIKLISMQLRMLATKGEGVYLRGLRKALPIIRRFNRVQQQRDGTKRAVWIPPDIRCAWGPYYQPTETDQKAAGECVRADLQAKIIKRVTAVKQIAPFYGIENPAQYADDLEEEDAKTREDLHKASALLDGKEPDTGDGATEEPLLPPERLNGQIKRVDQRIQRSPASA